MISLLHANISNNHLHFTVQVADALSVLSVAANEAQHAPAPADAVETANPSSIPSEPRADKP
jgi:hypothetical protein